MGMRRRRCDRCGKKRPFEEGTGHSGTGPACEDGQRFVQLSEKTAMNWKTTLEGKVCKWCVKREADKAELDEQEGIVQT